MFATASAMGEEASWNTRAKLQHTWREVAKRNEQYNVTIFQLYCYVIHKCRRIWPSFSVGCEPRSDIYVYDVDEYWILCGFYSTYQLSLLSESNLMDDG
ncbi:hypothetical protein ANCDUO_24484 [Ancylostoma duodenale]|uniref:Uncharacterized protein n=1 Tax=Ancylostoma duodenale TaxID=51022 RepID=A0A0C2FAD7_9BILA|nr:hypothetical protein ANCDUO_24484 [Ancylostoma duodenale]